MPAATNTPPLAGARKPAASDTQAELPDSTDADGDSQESASVELQTPDPAAASEGQLRTAPEFTNWNARPSFPRWLLFAAAALGGLLLAAAVIATFWMLRTGLLGGNLFG